MGRLVPDWATTPKLIWQAYTYGYKLDYDLAWMACGLFVAIGVVHMILTVSSTRARHVYWMYLPVFTAGMEALGYAYRVLSAEHVTTAANGGPTAPLGEVIASFVLLLVPPIILAVVNYKVVGKVMKASGVKVLCMTDKSITRIFLSLDLLCFLIQCGAAPLLIADDAKSKDAGSNIVLTGLVLQFFIFLLFVFVSMEVMRKPEVRQSGALVWRVVSICLATIFTLLVRNGYRLYEYSYAYTERKAHPTVAVVAHEWEFYVFEWAPVWAVHAVFAAYNFGWMIPPDAEFAVIMGRTPAAAPGAAAGVDGAKAPAALEDGGNDTPVSVGVEEAGSALSVVPNAAQADSKGAAAIV